MDPASVVGQQARLADIKETPLGELQPLAPITAGVQQHRFGFPVPSSAIGKYRRKQQQEREQEQQQQQQQSQKVSVAHALVVPGSQHQAQARPRHSGKDEEQQRNEREQDAISKLLAMDAAKPQGEYKGRYETEFNTEKFADDDIDVMASEFVNPLVREQRQQQAQQRAEEQALLEQGRSSKEKTIVKSSDSSNVTFDLPADARHTASAERSAWTQSSDVILEDDIDQIVASLEALSMGGLSPSARSEQESSSALFTPAGMSRWVHSCMKLVRSPHVKHRVVGLQCLTGMLLISESTNCSDDVSAYQRKRLTSLFVTAFCTDPSVSQFYGFIMRCIDLSSSATATGLAVQLLLLLPRATCLREEQAHRDPQAEELGGERDTAVVIIADTNTGAARGATSRTHQLVLLDMYGIRPLCDTPISVNAGKNKHQGRERGGKSRSKDYREGEDEMLHIPRMTFADISLRLIEAFEQTAQQNEAASAIAATTGKKMRKATASFGLGAHNKGDPFAYMGLADTVLKNMPMDGAWQLLRDCCSGSDGATIVAAECTDHVIEQAVLFLKRSLVTGIFCKATSAKLGMESVASSNQKPTERLLELERDELIACIETLQLMTRSASARGCCTVFYTLRNIVFLLLTALLDMAQEIQKTFKLHVNSNRANSGNDTWERSEQEKLHCVKLCVALTSLFAWLKSCVAQGVSVDDILQTFYSAIVKGIDYGSAAVIEQMLIEGATLSHELIVVLVTDVMHVLASTALPESSGGFGSVSSSTSTYQHWVDAAFPFLSLTQSTCLQCLATLFNVVGPRVLSVSGGGRVQEILEGIAAAVKEVARTEGTLHDAFAVVRQLFVQNFTLRETWRRDSFLANKRSCSSAWLDLYGYGTTRNGGVGIWRSFNAYAKIRFATAASKLWDGVTKDVLDLLALVDGAMGEWIQRVCSIIDRHNADGAIEGDIEGPDDIEESSEKSTSNKRSQSAAAVAARRKWMMCRGNGIVVYGVDTDFSCAIAALSYERTVEERSGQQQQQQQQQEAFSSLAGRRAQQQALLTSLPPLVYSRKLFEASLCVFDACLVLRSCVDQLAEALLPILVPPSQLPLLHANTATMLVNTTSPDDEFSLQSTTDSFKNGAFWLQTLLKQQQQATAPQQQQQEQPLHAVTTAGGSSSGELAVSAAAFVEHVTFLMQLQATFGRATAVNAIISRQIPTPFELIIDAVLWQCSIRPFDPLLFKKPVEEKGCAKATKSSRQTPSASNDAFAQFLQRFTLSLAQWYIAHPVAVSTAIRSTERNPSPGLMAAGGGFASETVDRLRAAASGVLSMAPASVIALLTVLFHKRTPAHIKVGLVEVACQCAPLLAVHCEDALQLCLPRNPGTKEGAEEETLFAEVEQFVADRYFLSQISSSSPSSFGMLESSSSRFGTSVGFSLEQILLMLDSVGSVRRLTSHRHDPSSKPKSTVFDRFVASIAVEAAAACPEFEAKAIGDTAKKVLGPDYGREAAAIEDGASLMEYWLGL